MKSKVLILRALPWNRDARVKRWADIYFEYKPIYGVWGKDDTINEVYSITKFPKITKNKILISIGYFWFSIKCFWFVFKNAKKDDKVVFIDLETIIFGWFGAYLKRAKIHYDIADPFYLAKPVPWKKLWKNIEKFFINHVPIVTLPHIKRLKLFFDNEKKPISNIVVVENIPFYQNESIVSEQNISKNFIHIGYFGGLEKQVRGLEILVDIVNKNSTLYLTVAGDGELYEFFKQAAAINNRIKFYGAFDSKDLPYLVSDIDIYFAYYDSSKELHAYAAPNKFYEHLYFGIPILTSKVIPQSNEIIKNNTGWCVENENDLAEFLMNIHHKRYDLKKYRLRAKLLWKRKYTNYYSNISKKLLSF